MTLALVLMGMFASANPAPVKSALAADNPIVTENQQTGSSDWQIGPLVADDATGQIKGYASATSVNQNQSLTLYVTVNPSQTYTIDFYRIGWYAGLGGRLLLHAGPLPGVTQPSCPRDPSTGLIACNWSPGYVLVVPATWTSGVYFGLLTNAAGYQNYIIFVVRDGRPAPLLYQQSVTTYQAYNNYPDDNVLGKSLYSYNSYGPITVSGETRAVKVSFDRPYTRDGSGEFLWWEVQLVRWLEGSGYDVTYSTDVDTHENAGALRNSKAFASTGHDEYWSKPMRDGIEAARDLGINLLFFGANTTGWQIRFEPSAAGVPDRVMVCYKDETIDPVQGPTTTTTWRDPPIDRAEQTLLGVQFTSQVDFDRPADYVVTNSTNWVYAGTGLRDGDAVPGLVGYELDRFFPDYPPPNATSRTLLSQSPVINGLGMADYSNSSIYRAPSGAWVFATGTMSWSWGLDDFTYLRADARIQRTTANIVNVFLGSAPPPTMAAHPIGVLANPSLMKVLQQSWFASGFATAR